MFSAHKQLEEDFLTKATSLEISGTWYDEIYGVTYKLQKLTMDWLLEQKYTPHMKEDKNERDLIINHFKALKPLFNKDPFTRQAVFTPKYANNPDLAACISCIQVIVRREKVNVEVFVRSQHFTRNFLYDNQTYSMLMQEMAKMLKVERGVVDVKIISLHKEMNT